MQGRDGGATHARHAALTRKVLFSSHATSQQDRSTNANRDISSLYTIVFNAFS